MLGRYVENTGSVVNYILVKHVESKKLEFSYQQVSEHEQSIYNPEK